MNTQCCFQKSLKWQRCHFDAQSSEVFFQKKKKIQMNLIFRDFLHICLQFFFVFFRRYVIIVTQRIMNIPTGQFSL